MNISMMPMALAHAITDCDNLRGKISGIGMLKEMDHFDYIWRFQFVRRSDGKQLSTWVSVPRNEVEYNMYDPETELMEIIQLAIYEALVNG